VKKARETARLERLAQVVEGSLPAGSELVEARFSAGPLLSLFVDREDGPVDHEFCSRVVSAVSPALESEGYGGMFEVSSPGIERPLTKPEHFRRFLGHRARVRTRGDHDGRRSFTGELLDAGDDGVTVAAETGVVSIAYADIHRSNLLGD
jgi:ribosome maturation factor RimP